MQEPSVEATLPAPSASKPARSRRKPANPAEATAIVPARKVKSFKLTRSKTPASPVVGSAPDPTPPVDAAEKPGKTEKIDKLRKPKLVRDSFTIPKNEYTALAQLKERAVGLARPVKKSELLRAGLIALSAMSDAALGKALACVPSVKTGRPRNSDA